MHQAERALFDLRRSVPVVVADDIGSEPSVLVFPVESFAEQRLDELANLAGSPMVLSVTRHRLQAMGFKLDVDAASFDLDKDIDWPVQTLFDAAATTEPSWRGLLNAPRPAHRVEHAGLNLLRRALLVPSALTAVIHPDRLARIDQAIEDGRLLRLPASQAERCLDLGGRLLRRISEADVPLQEAEQTRFVLFRENDGLREHLAVQIGSPDDWPDAVPVRMHSACLTGDLFGSLRCDCGEQLRNAVARIRELGGGVLLYLAQEGRGIGLANKLRAYALQDQGLDTVEADQTLGFSEDERRYGIAVDMLRALDIERIHLLTNNPTKVHALSNGGIQVQANDRLYGQVTQQNRRYLTAKAKRSGHLLEELLDGT